METRQLDMEVVTLDARKKEAPVVKESKPSSELISRTEQELSNMEEELQEYYCEAGKAILETAETEGRKINDLVDRIIDTKKKLLELRRETICPDCIARNDRSDF